MSLEYLIAKNNSRTCLYSNVHLHSAYNPENESHRFVENIQIDYIPENIIIIEPALAYCNQFLKEKFPNSAYSNILWFQVQLFQSSSFFEE
mgnify:CR=1 FL=1